MRPGQSPRPSDIGFWVGLVLALLVVAVLAVLVIGRLIGRNRPLTSQQRAEYTERLARLLEKGDGDVAPIH